MPHETYNLQREIIDVNQGQDQLKHVLGLQDNFTIDAFIISEDVAYKIGMHPDAAPDRKVAAEIIQYSLTKNLGDEYISVAIRGDNRCSQRSLIFLALIAARRLIYQERAKEANQLLNTLGQFADELIARINEPQFSALRNDFTQENYSKFKTLLTNISTATVDIKDLVLQANADFSVQYVPEPDGFNLALSSLTAFIMDKKLTEQSSDIGLPKAFLSDEGNDYAVLSPGMRGSTSADRVAFLSALNLKLNVPILRVNSVLETMRARGITRLDQAIVLDDVFNLIAIENDDGHIETSAFNSGGHTNLILTAEDRFYIQRELSEHRLHLSDKSPTDIPQITTSVPLNRVPVDSSQQVSEVANRDTMANTPTNYSFMWKCLNAIAVAAGASLLVVGIIYAIPILSGLGLGVGLLGGLSVICQVASNGFFSTHLRENPKSSSVMNVPNGPIL